MLENKKCTLLIKCWLLIGLSGLTLLLALLALKTFSQTTLAQNSEPYRIEMRATLTDSGLGVLATVFEDQTPVYGPFLSYAAGNDTENHWQLRGYFYQYVADSKFNCNNTIANEALDLSANKQKEWMDNKGLSSEWNLQKDTFSSQAPREGYAFKFSDNSWRVGVDKPVPQGFQDGSKQLAYCLQVKKHSGEDAVVNNIVFNLSDINASRTGVEVSQTLENSSNQAAESFSSSVQQKKDVATTSSSSVEKATEVVESGHDQRKTTVLTFSLSILIVAFITVVWLYGRFKRSR